MATFTTRPVKAGLPTLFEIQQADVEERHQMQLIALVAIAGELAEAVEQLMRLTEWKAAGELLNDLERE